MMKAVILASLVFLASCSAAPIAGAAEGPSLTIYNQNFGVVRDFVELNLGARLNRVTYAESTAFVEPASVILRDPRGEWALSILEQNYRADPVSEGLLLSLYEGQAIDFEIVRGDVEVIIPGRIIRSGYAPPVTNYRRIQSQPQMQPIIEMEGSLRFGLPGRPLFPALADDTVLKPTFHWLINSGRAGKLNAELCYVTSGMSWEADYNLVSPEKGNEIDLVGWVTMVNQTGKTFTDARIKLMAGDVSKIQPQLAYNRAVKAEMQMAADATVTEKAFDEFRLYTVARLTTLRDSETKQVEFVRAAEVQSETIYIYKGSAVNWRQFSGWQPEQIMRQREYGNQSNTKIWVMREFVNSEENNLGVPLPRGRVRFYRRDDDGQLEFTGENIIDHTPKNETLRIYTGDAFDLVAERKQTDYTVDVNRRIATETFEIKLRNQKETDAVQIRVVEEMFRWHTWRITNKTHDFEKTDSRTIEFRVNVQPETEEIVTYTVEYTW